MFYQKIFGILLFILYISVVLLLNTLPLELATQINDTVWGEFRLDYLTHALIFLPWIFFQFWFRRIKKRSWFLLGFVLALLIEGIQYYLPYRSFNMYDVLFNVAGLIMSYLLFSGLYLKLQDFFEEKK
ncbi:MAG: VanZ family protein, partial [Bacteroidales bacterium]|nr:VanZ family protein [Bacteroidales bacterium]OQA87118.1 MAG: VanZ like family protein [Bacteroidetes bacterium ADurb.Bin234]